MFQAGDSVLCQRAVAAKRVLLTSQLADRFSVAQFCRQLGVARSGFFAWRQRLQIRGNGPWKRDPHGPSAGCIRAAQ